MSDQLPPDTPPPELRARCDELTERLADGTLTAAEAAELSAALRQHPALRAEYLAACVQAQALRDLLATEPPAPPPRRPVRRRGLVAACGLAAAVAVAVFLLGPKGPAGGVRLVSADGEVRVGGRTAGAGDAIPVGEPVRTVGQASSAVLAYPDGTRVTMGGDTETRVDDPDRRLAVVRGLVTAQVSDGPFTISTPEAVTTASVNTCLSVGREGTTDVGVSEGQAVVTGPVGGTLADVRPGGVVTIDTRGGTVKVIAGVPDAYAWDLSEPLPSGWVQGRAVDDPLARPSPRSLAPTFWHDPHIDRDCWQIRSDNRWVRGLFAVHPDSVARVRYKVDRAGTGQLLAVIRTADLARRDGNVLLAPLEFAPAPDGGWREAVLPLADWQLEDKPGRQSPGPPPWVAFQVVFNTYEQDLGLRVAEFAVTRPARR